MVVIRHAELHFHFALWLRIIGRDKKEYRTTGHIHAIFIRDIKYLWVIFVLFSENIAECPFGLNKDTSFITLEESLFINYLNRLNM